MMETFAILLLLFIVVPVVVLGIAELTVIIYLTVDVMTYDRRKK